MAKLEQGAWAVAAVGLTVLAINAHQEQQATDHNKQIHEGIAATGENSNTYETAPDRYFLAQQASRTNEAPPQMIQELLETNRSLNDCTDRYRREEQALIRRCMEIPTCRETLRVEARQGTLLASDGTSSLERMEITVPAIHLRVNDVSENSDSHQITEGTAPLIGPFNATRITTTLATERTTLEACRSKISQITGMRAQLQTPARVNISSR